LAQLWIQVVGSKNAGKTSLLEDVVRELVRRGRSVCYVKHRHEDARLDASDTDTSRMMEAGASAAVLVGSNSTIIFRGTDEESLARVAQRDSLPGDIVLAEGWKSVPGAKIVLTGGDLDITAMENVVAVVGEAPPTFTGSTIDRDDIGAICDAIERTSASGGGNEWRTSLLIDGREVPLNAFVQDVFASGVLGMSLALQGVEDAGTLELRCVRKKGR
jgi:molybdopterin-guanine dinucleotide biosynthesis protein MobB